MTNKSWFALGIGKKNKKGEYLDMYFHPDHISSSETKLEKSSDCLLYTSDAADE